MNPSSVYVRKTKPTFANALIPAIALIIVGIVVLTKIILLGLLLIVLGVFALTLTEGLEIDFTRRRIRIFFGVFGLRFGKWDMLPEMGRITLVPVQVKNLMTSSTNLTTEATATYFQIRLYPQGSAEYYIASIGKLNSCQTDATLLSGCFGLTYEDYTN
ncbi:hypothetical protein GXP67_24125 [Rhodocytophaga rosea]|uniref:Uncharacterized protein n=1 Tax=Rhodocytophaga rosea TaxID=2704465 RepID=A0A6C0GPF9_9BACT|nr:hypothetical protein [Rhodocytophaga rosea]QHT69510.1 hypothetical protein GXP67_24125 [Rhodocytophaga rosea]